MVYRLPFENYQVTNLPELLMLNALFVWSQNDQNPVSISLSRESCYPYPGVIFMVGWPKRIPSCKVMSFSQLFSEPTPTAGARC